MKKSSYTAILEFEIIAPTNDLEKVGETLSLSTFGEYCPQKSMRGYNLLYLLDHPKHYRVSSIVMRGTVYIIPKGREQNYVPRFSKDTEKYHLWKISDNFS
jgi:hypothetical protein